MRDFSGPSHGALASEGNLLYVVTANGHGFTLDLSSYEMIGHQDLVVPRDQIVADGKVLLSADERHLYVGVASVNSGDLSAAREVLILDTDTWEQSATLRATSPFRNWSRGPGPVTITIHQDHASLVMIDALTGAQQGRIDLPTDSPGLVEVPLQGTE